MYDLYNRLKCFSEVYFKILIEFSRKKVVINEMQLNAKVLEQ